MSVINQTRTPNKIIIYDDSIERVDLRENPAFAVMFHLMFLKGIENEVIYGYRRGQHWGHQMIQDKAQELIWRIDDDEIAEPDVLRILELRLISDKGIGAVAGLVLPPGAQHLDFPANTIENTGLGNCQWFVWSGVKRCEHLYSSYLYRKGIHDFDTSLSQVAHREETLHTYGIFKKGFRLLVDAAAVTYHFRASTGGIRISGTQEDWDHDEIAYQETLREYEGHKVCYLDSGMGDHIVFKTILPKIKAKYKSVTLAVCYPELFPEEKCISLAEGQKICNPERHNIFKWCIDKGWKDKEIKYAYTQMYGVEI
jgi:hypothetical protein